MCHRVDTVESKRGLTAQSLEAVAKKSIAPQLVP